MELALSGVKIRWKVKTMSREAVLLKAKHAKIDRQNDLITKCLIILYIGMTQVIIWFSLLTGESFLDNTSFFLYWIMLDHVWVVTWLILPLRLKKIEREIMTLENSAEKDT